jgi:formylmethanofuran dehydrogenase subunit C
VPSNLFLLPFPSGFDPLAIGVINLAAPSFLIEIASTPTTVTVQWDVVTSATEYVANILNWSTGDTVQTVLTTSLECTFDGLIPATLYFVTVAATAPGSSSITLFLNTLLPLAADGLVLISGGAANLNISSGSANGVVIVSGTASILRVTLTAPGNVIISGADVIVISRELIAADGSVIVSGAAALRQTKLLLAQGRVVVTGASAF